ncbi:MAG: flippase [Sarcina sp.]
MKSLKKNYFYNLVFTVVNMIFPLITAPYLSFILGAENIGKVNYATSIVTWFTLFAAFGIPRYGIREIARNRDNRKDLSKSFWNLISIQFILSMIAIVVYLGVIFTVPNLQADKNLYVLMVVMIILNIFSIDWFYQGIEEYGYITIRNIIFKVISIILIFTMIKDKDDYIFYALINIFGLSFNNLLNYISAQKHIDKKIYEFRILHYLKELKVYFMTTLVIALYTQLDQTFIGSISQKDLAYYLRSKTVFGVGFSVVNSAVTIFIPRTAYLVKHNYEEYKKIIEKSINYIYLLALPCVVGIFILAEEIMIFLGGNEFIEAQYSVMIICILCLFTSIGSWQVNQVLIPNGKEKIAFKIQTATAVISIILNIALIPRYTYIGASIAWLLSEIFLMVTEAIFIRREVKEIKIKYINMSLIKYLISVIFMGIGVIGIKILMTNNNLLILVSIIVAPIIYFGMIIILKEKIVLEGVQQILKKKINK